MPSVFDGGSAVPSPSALKAFEVLRTRHLGANGLPVVAAASEGTH